MSDKILILVTFAQGRNHSLNTSLLEKSYLRGGGAADGLNSDLEAYSPMYFLSQSAASCCSSPHCVGLFSVPFLALEPVSYQYVITQLTHHITVMNTIIMLKFYAYSTYSCFYSLFNQDMFLCDLALEQTCITVF